MLKYVHILTTLILELSFWVLYLMNITDVICHMQEVCVNVPKRVGVAKDHILNVSVTCALS